MTQDWQWIDPSTGTPVSPTYSSQEDAEAFMTSGWEELMEQGVEQVTLRHGNEDVYGPMPLSAG